MIDSSIERFKRNFKDALLANIHKSYGSVAEFADDKGYSNEQVFNMLEGNFTNIDQFLKLLLDTNWSVTFTDHFDHNFNFPDSFTVPLLSNDQLNKFA
jgi:hypothetical protein